MKSTDIIIDNIGISEALLSYRLKVPANQRDYAWEPEEQVQEYLQDISNAMSQGGSIYFLGTLMLIGEENSKLEVADGQQRLATTSIVLSVIRDMLKENGDNTRAEALQSNFLYSVDFVSAKEQPKLALNIADNDYFRNTILYEKKNRVDIEPTRYSQKLLKQAATKVRSHFDARKAQLGEHFNDELVRWVEFLKNSVKTIAVKVSNEENAFLLFETLNDRGIDVSVADLVKNYLFQKTEDGRMAEAQMSWSSIKGAVESVSDKDLIMEFLRFACCIRQGQTTEREVFNKIKGEIKSNSDTMLLLSFYKQLSTDYAAIYNSEHPKWSEYDSIVKKSILTITTLGVKQIKPLMLAVAKFFDKAETAAAYRKMVSWSVRFLISNVKGGRLDIGYSTLANQIYKGEIKTAEELRYRAESFMITDGEFFAQFRSANVSIAKLARYYLRSLETTAREQKEPEFIPNDSSEITLEHIMPKTIENGWANIITERDIESHHYRLGNMVLLQSTKNSKLGSQSFEKKSEIYRLSAFLLTEQISNTEKWTVNEIDARQEGLAELALRTWPL